MVFNSETGAYKRHWGAYGEKPGADPGAYDPSAPAARQFRDVTCVDIGKDNMVYVCDRSSNRIQVFGKDGKFVKEAIIAKDTRARSSPVSSASCRRTGRCGTSPSRTTRSSATCSSRTATNKKVTVLDRATLTEVGSIGDGGRQPGRFLAVGSIAVDSKGNLYTGEQHHGKRVQSFVPGR